MGRHTTLRIGGPATLDQPSSIAAALRRGVRARRPAAVSSLSAGSNLLVRDGARSAAGQRAAAAAEFAPQADHHEPMSSPGSRPISCSPRLPG